MGLYHLKGGLVKQWWLVRIEKLFLWWLCIAANRLLGFHSALRITNSPVDDNSSRTAGLVMLDDKNDCLVEDAAEALVGNQDATGLNVGDLKCVPIRKENESINWYFCEM